jgi:hypothetical protein
MMPNIIQNNVKTIELFIKKINLLQSFDKAN